MTAERVTETLAEVLTDDECGEIVRASIHPARVFGGRGVDVLLVTVERILARRDAAVRAEGAAEVVARIEALADEWERDDEEHLGAWGQHLPGSVGRMAELLRAAIARADRLEADQ